MKDTGSEALLMSIEIIMRKRLKRKRGRHTCQMCKPYKHGWGGFGDNRWKPKDLLALREFERKQWD